MNTSFNPSVNNNTFLRPSLLQQEQPKFGLAPEPAVDAQKPEATDSKFAPLVASNSNKVDEATDSDSAAGLANPDHFGFWPGAHNNNWQQQRHQQNFGYGKSWNTPHWPPAPQMGVPDAVAHKPFTSTTEVVGASVNNNWGNPWITSNQLSHDWNLPKHGADALTRLASRDGNPYNENPTAHAGQLDNLLRERAGWGGATTTHGVGAHIRELSDTASIPDRIIPGLGLDRAGYGRMMADAGVPSKANEQSFYKLTTLNPWDGVGQFITPGDMLAGGLTMDHQGRVRLSEFATMSDRAHFG